MTTSNTTIAAVPYNGYQLSFFYADSAEEYNEKLEAGQKQDPAGDFEHELQFIDGETSQEVLDSCESVELFFEIEEQFSEMTETQQAAFHAMTEILFMSVTEAMSKLDDVCVMQTTINDYAFDLAKESGLCEFAMRYFDYQAYGRDILCNGGVTEFRFEGEDYLLLN